MSDSDTSAVGDAMDSKNDGLGYLKGLIEGQEKRISKVEIALENYIRDVSLRLGAVEKLLSRWMGIGVGAGIVIGALFTLITAIVSHSGWRIF